jgi:cyclophilin family peptidyl-prolyl cis-trans isomerase
MLNTRHASGHDTRAALASAATVALALLLNVTSAEGATPRAQGQRRAGGAAATQRPSAATARAGAGVPADVLLKIVRAEDERRWDEAEMAALLASKSAAVRRRAALAAGRIGDEKAVQALGSLLRRDLDAGVRAEAAFALGEIESAAAADMLLTTLRMSKTAAERASAVEALGKIAAALPAAQEERRAALGAEILSALEAERKAARPNRALLLHGLTAVLRARPAGAGPKVAAFLSSTDARVRADALNTLARLRAKESLERVAALLASDPDAVVRANAARALGAAEDASRVDLLATRGLNDPDARVRVSAVRALAQLRGERAASALMGRAESLLAPYAAARRGTEVRPAETNELLEIATALGRVYANRGDRKVVEWLRQFREAEALAAPEVEVALARVAPADYLREQPFPSLTGPDAPGRRPLKSWQTYSALAQGLGELAAPSSEAGGNSVVSLKADAQILLITLLGEPSTPALALPDVMRALAAFKPANLGELMRAKLSADDFIVRSTAADIIGDLEPDAASARALASALPRALAEKNNDAALSILGALGKQRSSDAAASIRPALEVEDYVVRRRAAALLKGMGAGDATTMTAATRNRDADYARALARANRSVRARVETVKGAFTIELLASDAPLTVDNFVSLARAGYFNGIAFHRVVPNFVVQGGDPRGDGNGGPGYQIRCEINHASYDRGAVGMALSGKDTGGSQWFVTHSPQPHLDGGYTVFGRVVEGLDVVDRIARGDRINGVTVTEQDRPPAGARPRGRGRALTR